MKCYRVLLATALGAALLAPGAWADHPWNHPHPGPDGWRHQGGPRHGHGGWGGDIHHFRDDDMARWNGGRWYQGPHGGRHGWWWIVGGSWYFYPAPVYPYPNPYVPPMVAPQPGPVWYYCQNPAGYYPYVPACRYWRVVPAQ